MIFSQTQKQAILLLIGLMLGVMALSSFLYKKPTIQLRQVSPLLLERPKSDYPQRPKYEKKAFAERQKKPAWKTGTATSVKRYVQKAPPKRAVINLNEADSAALDAIPGIGPKLTLRIFKYKSLIGQFVAVAQLRRVYGLSEENYLRMSPYLKAEPVGELVKKDLNSEKSYKIAWIVGKEMAKLLAENRTKRGWFEDWEQVAEVVGPESNDLQWLQAYYLIGSKERPAETAAAK